MQPGDTRVLSQLRRGVLEYCVLALLRERPRYGFDLVRELSAAEGLLTSEGTIYPLLSRLRKDGLVSTNWQESTAGPPRRYYALTGDGRTALGRFLEDWARFRDGVDGVLGGGLGDTIGDTPPAETAPRPEHPDLVEKGPPR
jgi:PadR family transcriptional regulator PadR